MENPTARPEFWGTGGREFKSPRSDQNTLDNQGISEQARKVSDDKIGTKGRRSAENGTESPEKVPNDVRQAFPVIIAEWPRNKREVIRVSLDEYQGRKTIDCRCWWHDDHGELKPGRSGLTLALKHLPKLAQSLANALAQANALGFDEVNRTE